MEFSSSQFQGLLEAASTWGRHDGYLFRILWGKKAMDAMLASLALGAGTWLGELRIRGSYCGHGFTNLDLRAIASCSPYLKVLYLWNAPSIDDQGLMVISNR